MTTFAPRHCDIWPWMNWKASTFNATTRTNGSGYLGMGVLDLDANSTTGCYISYEVALDAGTWTLTLIYQKNVDCGIVTPSLGGSDLSTVDTYAASADDQVAQWTGITVATAGVYTLKFRTDSKHASSSDYDLMLQLVTLTRTGA